MPFTNFGFPLTGNWAHKKTAGGAKRETIEEIASTGVRAPRK
jgi:hypothetical protein